MVGEGRRVDLEPGLLVLPDDEGTEPDAGGRLGDGGVVRGQRPAHLPQLAHPLGPGPRRERGRTGVVAVRPRGQLLRQQPRHLGRERGPHAAQPVPGVDRSLDRPAPRSVLRRDLGVPDQLAAHEHPEVPDALAVVPQRELAGLGDGPGAVGAGRGVEEGGHRGERGTVQGLHVEAAHRATLGRAARVDGRPKFTRVPEPLHGARS